MKAKKIVSLAASVFFWLGSTLFLVATLMPEDR